MSIQCFKTLEGLLFYCKPWWAVLARQMAPNDNNLETSEYVESPTQADPFEGFNRAMWNLNCSI